jgi:glycosyltransferase 2 family protein
VTPSQPAAIQVTDRLERRIRKPVDLLRCTTSGIEIIVLAVAGVAASATTTGVETDIVGASRRLHTLLVVARPLVLFAILIVPVALAVRQLFRRQVQRLAEAVATGLLAAAAAAVINAALRRAFAARVYDAIIMARPGTSHVAALDPYLAGLVAYATIIGLSGRPGWRNALWLAVGVYALVQLVNLDTTVLCRR